MEHGASKKKAEEYLLYFLSYFYMPANFNSPSVRALQQKMEEGSSPKACAARCLYPPHL